MSKSLRILVVEDRPTDAELMIHEVRRAGLEPEWQRVETEQAFLAALESAPDLILSDYSLPRFDGMRAIKLLRERGLDIPLILVSGTLGEEAAVAAMKEGATDYLLKDRTARLGIAVETALEQKRLRDERRQHEQELQAAQAKLRQLLEHSPAVLYTLKLEGGEAIPQLASDNLTRIVGYEVAETLQADWWRSHLHPDDRDGTVAAFHKTIATGAGQTEFRIQHKDGSWRWISDRQQVLRDEAGQPREVVGVWVDITEAKELESMVKLRERQLRSFFTAATAGLAILSPDLRYLHINETLADMNGVTVEDHLGRSVEEVVPELAPVLVPLLKKVLTTGQAVLDHEMSGETPQQPGQNRHWMASFFPVFDAEHRISSLGAVVVEVTQQKRLELELRESDRRFSEMMGKVDLISMMLDREGRVTYCNDYLLSLTGWRREEVLGRNWFDAFVPPKDASELRTAFPELLANSPGAWHRENEILTRSGERRLIQWNNLVLRSLSGEVVGTASIGADITKRKRAETALLENQKRTTLLLESTTEGICGVDLEGHCTFINRTGASMIGGKPETIVGQDMHQLVHHHRPDQTPHPREECPIFQSMQQGQPCHVTNDAFWRLDGSSFPVDFSASPILEDGVIRGAVVCFSDITERRRLEEQFRQAQKMEAVGRLAGGVAHDFNNLLAVMIMRTDLASMESGLPAEVRETLQEVRAAADRAANLTRQLLAFSRRQVMQPRHLELNESVQSLARMLQRVLGEDIRLRLKLHPGPLITYADPGMLDQVLMNLAVNARDAMPQGGRLTLETMERTLDEVEAQGIPEVSPGRFVALKVSDTGSGISTENLPRIFEPFFTTKEPGHGTGLGLATVFGIVKQHNGWLRVHSEVETGTTFEIFLPASAPDATVTAPTSPRSRSRGGRELILLVEDDEPVRALMRLVLERHGYRVVEAIDGVEATQAWKEHKDQVALLLTDLVLPSGITGQELAGRLRKEKPGLKVVFSSGYSTEIAGRELKLQPGQGFVQKPSPPDQLLETVRKTLDG